MSGRDKHEEFFEQGVAAYNRVIGSGEYYVCPICTRGFSRDDLVHRRLTLEHVPPESVGGTKICLTCRGCNSAGGHQADYALAELGRLRTMRAALRGEEKFDGKIRLEAGGIALNATLRIDDGGVRIELPEGINNPERFHAQIVHFRKQHGVAEPDLTFQITAGFRFGHRPLFISLLRAAYLAAFAWFGYRYALNPRLDVVREQILKPEVLTLPNTAINIVAKDDLQEPESLITLVSSPLEALAVYLPSSMVQIPRAVTVLLPWLRGPDDFYPALNESYEGIDGQRRLDFVASPLGWPIGPALLLDFV